MDDASVQDRIEALVSEEHELLSKHGADGLADAEHERLAAIKVELDRYWDLLRQRRAHEEFDLDPDNTSLRSADTVEGYDS